ncbi:hypothetical protein AAG747_05890 [Rapidithrix thailandica]|uniref:Transporter n=1 Tax=Rapidithrix thailandica TaxID=413964 RepID=A0AAW9RUU6_9BACT
MKASCTFLFCVLFSSFAFAQGYGWWNQKHRWDGITHWTKYMVLSPGYMGPNALPVPKVFTDTLHPHFQIETGVEGHFSKGDNTRNVYTNVYLPIASDKVGLEFFVIPVEYYRMDTLTRDKRRSRDFDGRGYSQGDIYVTTYVQLLKNHKYWPNLLLSIGIKTASGSNLKAARFTDTPGYFFDVTFSKKIKNKYWGIKYLVPIVKVGFYAWQTNRNDYLQDDAVVYGIGFKSGHKFLELESILAGYYGYIGNGDQPMVYRLTLRTQLKSMFNFQVRGQLGLEDYNYTSIRISTLFTPRFK